MELVNALYLVKDEFQGNEQGRELLSSAVSTVLTILSPFTPHLCEELWQAIGGKNMLLDASWPTYDETALVKDEVEIVLQVNGKVRGKLLVPVDETDKKNLEALALADANVVRHTEGLTVRKVIVIPGKLVNVVAN